MANIDYKNIASQWLDFGNIDSLIKKFEDAVIPQRYSKEMQHGFFFQKDEELYHFKTLMLKKYYLRELLGELVSKSLSISTIECVPARIKMQGKDVFGIVSKWVRTKENEYFSIEEFKKELDVLENPLGILDVLEKKYSNSSIPDSFRDFLARDFFTHELDRKADEITFQSHQGEVSLGYICDYEYEFYKINQVIGVEKYYQMDLKKEKTLKRVLMDERLINSFKKTLKVELSLLLEQLETEKKMLITKEEKDNLLEFQNNSKNEIRRTLSL